MRLTFCGHACFLLEGSGLTILTDPYIPGSDARASSGLAPLSGDPPDVVVMSSASDGAHSCWQAVPGTPRVVNALDAVDAPISLSDDVAVTGVAAMEGDDRPDAPSPNAMFLLTLDDLRICHMGDIGTPLSTAQLSALAGRVDILLALAGGGLTIALDDLDEAIDAIGPSVVIPMHYRTPGILYDDLGPLQDFLDHRAGDVLVEVGASSVELSRDSLPAVRTTFVLEARGATASKEVAA